MAIFSTLIGMFNATITFNIGQVVIVVLTFCIQVLIGLSYLVVGFYGIVATVNLKAILSATEASMKRTVMWFKLTLLAYLMTCALMISMAIINIFLGRTISTIFYWIWTAVWITIASYCLYMQWSYKHWVVAGSSEGPNGPSFAKILKAGTAPGDTSNPPTAPPASSV